MLHYKGMANWKGHLTGGLVAGVVVASVATNLGIEYLAESAHLLQNWQPLAGLLIVSMLFGLFPDVDTNSKAQDIFLGTAFIVDILLIWNGLMEAAAYLGLIALLPIVSHHRGWTHRKWAMFLVPLPIILLPSLYNPTHAAVASLFYSAAVAGYFSHLLLDGLIWRRIRIRN